MSALRVSGYRPVHAPLLTGAWIAGELLCFAVNEARAVASCAAASYEDADRMQSSSSSSRLIVLPDVGYMRLSEIEGVHRRARLEIGLQGTFDAALAESALTAARESAFGLLNLNRVYGFVRATHPPTLAALERAGFACEATVPGGVRVGGRRVARQVWGALRSEWRS
jgi:hypothetical protein